MMFLLSNSNTSRGNTGISGGKEPMINNRSSGSTGREVCCFNPFSTQALVGFHSKESEHLRVLVYCHYSIC